MKNGWTSWTTYKAEEAERMRAYLEATDHPFALRKNVSHDQRDGTSRTWFFEFPVRALTEVISKGLIGP